MPTLELQSIEERLLAFLHEELLSPGMTVERDDDLLSGDILDSIAAVRLGAFVEEAFDKAIPPSDFVIENFQSVAALAAYIHRTLGES